MSETKSKHPAAHGERRRATDRPARARAKGGGWDEGRGDWLDRRGGERHAAITRTLYSWSSYKSWAEKVRSSWDADK
jgi:hypothetical protein